jgi:hypothetical protein
MADAAALTSCSLAQFGISLMMMELRCDDPTHPNPAFPFHPKDTTLQRVDVITRDYYV